VKVPGEFVANDDFAKQLGLEGIDQLRGLIRGQLGKPPV
jgi:trigger factor